MDGGVTEKGRQGKRTRERIGRWRDGMRQDEKERGTDGSGDKGKCGCCTWVSSLIYTRVMNANERLRGQRTEDENRGVGEKETSKRRGKLDSEKIEECRILVVEDDRVRERERES